MKEGVGFNRYAYAGGDPINASDANGHAFTKNDETNPGGNYNTNFNGGTLSGGGGSGKGHVKVAAAPLLAAPLLGAEAAAALKALGWGFAVGGAAKIAADSMNQNPASEPDSEKPTPEPNSDASNTTPPVDPEEPTGKPPSKGQFEKFKRELEKYGKKSLEKSKASNQALIDEHKGKIDKAKLEGGYTSAMEKEIRNWEREIQAIDRILKE